MPKCSAYGTVLDLSTADRLCCQPSRSCLASPSSATYFPLHVTQTHHRPSDPSPEPAAQRCSSLPPQLGVGLSLDQPSSSIPQVPHPVPCPTRLPGQLPILHRSCLPPSRMLSTTRVSVFTPADAVSLHHCSIRLQSLLLEHPHPTGSRLHLTELLCLTAAESRRSGRARADV